MSPDELHAEKLALIAEIYEAFKGVSREGGVSWSEADVIDDYGTDEERAAARERDTEWGWEELVDDPRWYWPAGGGGFSFLDAIGFRYYLPVALVREVREGPGGIDDLLLIEPPGHHMHEYDTGRIAALNERQRACVARVVRLMIAWCRLYGPEYSRDNWQKALDSYWHQF